MNRVALLAVFPDAQGRRRIFCFGLGFWCMSREADLGPGVNDLFWSRRARNAASAGSVEGFLGRLVML